MDIDAEEPHRACARTGRALGVHWLVTGRHNEEKGGREWIIIITTEELSQNWFYTTNKWFIRREEIKPLINFGKIALDQTCYDKEKNAKGIKFQAAQIG